jgi:hypothetical protein
VLLAAVLAERMATLPPALWGALPLAYPLVLVLGLAIVPAGWIVLARRHVRPRLGLAFVATPAEVLMRTRAGTLSARWKTLTRAYVEPKTSWTVLDGYHTTHRLVLDRADAATIRYDEAYLGIPVEVAQALCDAFKTGVLGAREAQQAEARQAEAQHGEAQQAEAPTQSAEPAAGGTPTSSTSGTTTSATRATPSAADTSSARSRGESSNATS